MPTPPPLPIQPAAQPAAGRRPGAAPATGSQPSLLPAILTSGNLPAATRRHWQLAILLVLGALLRVLAQVAYRPALLYIDSVKYLFGAYPGNDPPGYQLALRVFLHPGTLPMVIAGQHLAGLAMAAALYAVLYRRGVNRWLAALAVAPVLLDAYQLQIEQQIMPDSAFETLIVVALAVLLWKPRPRTWMVAGAAVALGVSATVRQVGLILVLPAALYVLAAVPGWRDKLIKGGVLGAAFVLPILGMCARNYVTLNHFALAPYAESSIYGRAASAADCATLQLPSYERPLCPARSQQAKGPDWLDHGAGSPVKSFTPPPGLYHYQVETSFSHQVFKQQPLRVAAAVARDAIKLFAVDRVTSPGDTPISRWQFQQTYPLYPPYITMRHGQLLFQQLTSSGAPKLIATGQRFGGGEPATSKPLAAALRSYQLGGGYTPGPLLLLSVLAGLAGTLTLLLRRLTAAQRATATACLLIVASGVTVLLMSDAFEFSWRYQLPALITLPPAGVLGITVVMGYFAARRRRLAGQQIPLQGRRPASAPGVDRREFQPRDRAQAS